MKSKYNSKFFLAYLKLLFLNKLPKVNLNETNILYILVLLCLVFSCTIFVYTFLTNWYSDNNNLNGLLTEVQGMILEVFFFAIIMNWIMVLRENAKQKPLKAYYHYIISEKIENFLRITLPDMKKNEKKYIYFLDNYVDTYYYDKLLIYECPKIWDIEIFEIAYKNNEYEYFYENHIKPRRVLINKLKRILLKNTVSFEHKIIYKFLMLENYNNALKIEENKITKDNCNFETINKFITSWSYRLFFMLLSEIRNLIINKSDKILSSIEEKKKQEQELEKWTKELAQIKSDT